MPTRFPASPTCLDPVLQQRRGPEQGNLKQLQGPSRAHSRGPGAAATGSPLELRLRMPWGEPVQRYVFILGARGDGEPRLTHGRRCPRSQGSRRHRSCLIKQLVSRPVRRDETWHPRSRARRAPLPPLCRPGRATPEPAARTHEAPLPGPALLTLQLICISLAARRRAPGNIKKRKHQRVQPASRGDEPPPTRVTPEV